MVSKIIPAIRKLMPLMKNNRETPHKKRIPPARAGVIKVVISPMKEENALAVLKCSGSTISCVKPIRAGCSKSFKACSRKISR